MLWAACAVVQLPLSLDNGQKQRWLGVRGDTFGSATTSSTDICGSEDEFAEYFDEAIKAVAQDPNGEMTTKIVEEIEGKLQNVMPSCLSSILNAWLTSACAARLQLFCRPHPV